MYFGQRPFRWQILILLIMFAFCGCAAKPVVEFYLVPTELADIQINTEVGSASLVQKGVQVTIEPLDEIDLFDLTKSDEVNPYLYVGRWGKVEPLYTVFEILVYNTEHKRVSIDESAILIDSDGNQYASLTYDYFRDLYANSKTLVSYRPNYYSPYNSYDPYYYTSQNYRAVSRSYRRSPTAKSARFIVRDTIFDGGHVFEGGKRVGFLIFDRLPETAKSLRVVVPRIVIYDNDDQISNIDFHFGFQQKTAIQP